MIEIHGIYNSAKCFCETLDEKAERQIKLVCDQAEFVGNKIRIMPDVHAGKGCTIGTTMTVTDKVVPGMVGVDIGCGMETVRIAERHIDFAALDALIRSEIPCGREIRKEEHPYAAEAELDALRCAKFMKLPRARRSIGTLGGGNHFIEVDRSETGEHYLVVHSGSRHLGKEAAEFYQDEGRRAFWGGASRQIEETIARLKAEGRFTEIQSAITALKKEHMIHVPRDLAYVEGELFEDYIHDMRIIQRFAALNRKAMTEIILAGMGWTEEECFTCIGKGNEDWNQSAPHGAGRLMSRTEARKTLSMETYRAEMQGIYSTCIEQSTLDESPMAYKSMDEIVRCIEPTATIVDHIRPVYNFKAAE